MWPKSVEKSIISTLVPPAALVWWSWWWRCHFWKQASGSLWPGHVCANEWLSTSANYRNSLIELSFCIWVITVVLVIISLAHQVTEEVVSVFRLSLSAGSDNLPPQQSCWSQFNNILSMCLLQISVSHLINMRLKDAKWKHQSFLQDGDKSFHFNVACQSM